MTRSASVRSWEKRGFRLRTSVSSLQPPTVIAAPALRSGFGPPGVADVVLPIFEEPSLSPDLALPKDIGISPNLALCPPVTETWPFQLAPPEVKDLSWWMEQDVLGLPETVSIFVPLERPRLRGKNYEESKSRVEERQPVLDGLDEECIHGITKAFCGICESAEKKRIEKTAPRKDSQKEVDVFDLLLPMLQPSLGEGLDNAILLPPGQNLYPFQRDGVRFLVEHDTALLADEMGLGKSIQAIIALRIHLRKARVTRCLLLCPRSVLFDWKTKLWEWAPEIRVCLVRGSKNERYALWRSPAHIHMTTYEMLREDINDLPSRNYDLVILDEIQKIKNPSAGVTQAVRRIDADARWGLSGTPLENRIDELISIFAYIKPGLLHYEDANNVARVKNAIKPFMLRRRIADVFDELPAKEHENIWLELTHSQRKVYDRAEIEGRIRLASGEEITIQHVLALITELKQICNMHPETGESSKLEYLTEQLAVLQENGEKALVFSQYPVKTLQHIAPRLASFKPFIFDGQLSDRKREDVVCNFQEKDDHSVLLMSVKAGGTGLTLTRANHVFHFDHWWNPAVALQAEGRTHRIGQAKTVFVSTLYTVDTIEQRIHAKLEEKRNLFYNVIDSLSDDNLGTLTEDDMFGLFGLQKVQLGRRIRTRANVEDLLSRIERLSPGEFEEEVAQLYRTMGFSVQETQFSRDGGVDLLAKRPTDAGQESLVIQCKHYPSHPVGVRYVRELFGVLQSRRDANRAVLVTSGDFSEDARAFAQRNSVELVSGSNLAGLFLKYDVVPK